jgi:hypothetical protein
MAVSAGQIVEERRADRPLPKFALYICPGRLASGRNRVFLKF